MEVVDRDAEIEKLEAVLAALEESAGISTQMKRVRGDCLNPPEVLGGEGDVTPDEEPTGEYDEMEEKEQTRDCYFAVEDVELRKKLIRLHREVDDQYVLMWEDDVTDAKMALSAARARADQLPWRAIAATGAAPVAVGYLAFHLAGAIAGAVAGMFLGMVIVKGARNGRAQELKKAEAELKEAKENARAMREAPKYFSLVEEHSGARDAVFERQSALEKISMRRTETPG